MLDVGPSVVLKAQLNIMPQLTVCAPILPQMDEIWTNPCAASRGFEWALSSLPASRHPMGNCRLDAAARASMMSV
jgi:hypothetical protein